MIRGSILAGAIGLCLACCMGTEVSAQQGGTFGATNAYGQNWSGGASNRDYSRFNNYPYVYYPQNYYGNEYYRSSNSLYYRYPKEMQIPVYNRRWHNYYPSGRRYHWGHHFITDVF